MQDLAYKIDMDVSDVIQLYTKQCTKDDFIYQLYKSWNNIKGTNIVNLEKLDKGGWAIDLKTDKYYYFLIDKDIDKNIQIPKDISISSFVLVSIYLKEVSRRESLQVINPINCIINNEVKHFSFDKISILESNKNKRKREVVESENIKRPKSVTLINWNEWLGASSTRNYFLDDPLIDWLKEYNVKDINDIPNKKEFNYSNHVKKSNITNNNFRDYIMNEGVNFEHKIMNILKSEKRFEIVQISDNYQSKNKDLFEKTLNYMKKGVDIIYQGILHDNKNKLYGSPDILIRNDIINKFVGYDIYDNNESSTKLNTEWHYVVIDIKNSIIHLKSDSKNIINDGSVPAYKAQLYVYTKILNEIQGTNINKSFILGKKYTWNSKGVQYEELECCKKLGIIDYEIYDNWVIDKFEKCKKWILDMREKGLNWSINPPSRKELYPNMKNDLEIEYNNVKKQIAEKYYEITDIYYCNFEKRINVHDKGILGWNDSRCNSSSLGFNPGIVSKRVDAILNVNRSKDFIRPEKIENGKWRTCFLSDKEYFLDFETINSAVGNYDDFIFMIGVGYIEDNNWIYRSFVEKDLKEESEKEILTKFLNYVDRDGIFYHWSNVEKSIYEKKMNKYNLKDIKFNDLNKFFVDNLIVVRGCLNWSLKNIAKKMYEYGFIKTNWNDDACKDGLTAMLLAYKIYNDGIDKKNFESIIKYNEIDCKVMYEILNYLRINH
jgi:hypothetical protein